MGLGSPGLFRFGIIAAALMLPTLGQCQAFEFSGSIQTAFVSGTLKGKLKNGERFYRTHVSASKGNWTAKASYWNYVFCDWHELDETNIQYSTDQYTATIGRFLMPVGQANWDDQWYSSFVFVPLIEGHVYGGRKVLERTSTGAQFDLIAGANNYNLSLTNSDPQVNQPIASRLDRTSFRWKTYKSGVQFGLSALADSATLGKKEQLLVADIRYTVPHLIVRGELLGYQSPTQRNSGFFVDANFRPRNWQDLTLSLRFEQLSSHLPTETKQEAWTLAAKARLPFESTLLINYTGGPDMGRLTLGGGWSFGLNKTFRF